MVFLCWSPPIPFTSMQLPVKFPHDRSEWRVHLGNAETAFNWKMQELVMKFSQV